MTTAVRKRRSEPEAEPPQADTLLAGERLSSPVSLAQTLAVSDSAESAEALAALPVDAHRYVQVRELGRGGMGFVDAVFDRALGRLVARKTTTRKQRGHLLAEAQTCAQLEHPSVVPVYDLGVDAKGKPYYTMRVLRGRTLRTVIDDNQ